MRALSLILCLSMTHVLADSTESTGSAGRPQLRGVNRSGGEYSCIKNLGILEGPVDDAAVKKMKTWKINAVRIPLNEDCWLGLNGDKHNPAYIGEIYRKTITDYINVLRNNDLKVILDLHVTGGLYEGPGQGECFDEAARCQKPMPDKQYAPKFWHSVASQFKHDDGIIFDLFNEPFPDMVLHDHDVLWKCWRDGGSACPGFEYEIAGMQDLVNAVRETGAKNLVMAGGVMWSGNLSGWLEYAPHDPANNLAASFHIYNGGCNYKECWEREVAPVAAKYPVIAGEVGESGCTHSYIDQILPWFDSKHISYIGWTWNTWPCSEGPSLIADYDGTPTEYGKGFRDHLAQF